MDFDLSADEEALVATVRKLCEGRFPIQRVRELEQTGGIDRELWRELAEAGAFSLRLPEASGGAGLGMVHAVLVFEELGRALVPGPVLASHLAAPLIDGAAGGEVVVGLVERKPPSTTLPVLVEHLDAVDALVALDGEGLWRIETAELDSRPVPRPLDPLTPVRAVDDLPQGERLAGADHASRLRTEATALASALLAGIAEAEVDLAVSYAKTRHQFGRAIGSFQALKHLMADMAVRAEVARVSVHAAGVTLDDPGVGDAERSVAGAKLLAGEAAIKNGADCIQVHGGMGFTWASEPHLYLKRAKVLDTRFGSADCQAAVMAGLIG